MAKGRNPGGVQAYPPPSPGAYGKENRVTGPKTVGKPVKGQANTSIVTKLPGAKAKIPK